MKLFIPYGGKEDWNDDLRYALRSLDKYFEPIEDIVYSSKLPTWLTNCESLQISKLYPKKLENKYNTRKYEQWFDSLNKLRAFANNITDEKFIYTYDDIILLREATRKEIIHYPQERVIPRHKVRLSRSRHGETILSAMSKCNNDYLFNYETHTPRIYETQKLKDLFKKYPLEKEVIPYSIATLYFNFYGNGKEKELIHINDYKVGFYGKPNQGNGAMPESTGEIDELVKNKIWLNYSYAGLMYKGGVLKNWLELNYQDKSKYEND